MAHDRQAWRNDRRSRGAARQAPTREAQAMIFARNPVSNRSTSISPKTANMSARQVTRPTPTTRRSPPYVYGLSASTATRTQRCLHVRIIAGTTARLPRRAGSVVRCDTPRPASRQATAGTKGVAGRRLQPKCNHGGGLATYAGDQQLHPRQHIGGFFSPALKKQSSFQVGNQRAD